MAVMTWRSCLLVGVGAWALAGCVNEPNAEVGALVTGEVPSAGSADTGSGASSPDQAEWEEHRPVPVPPVELGRYDFVYMGVDGDHASLRLGNLAGESRFVRSLDGGIAAAGL